MRISLQCPTCGPPVQVAPRTRLRVGRDQRKRTTGSLCVFGRGGTMGARADPSAPVDS